MRIIGLALLLLASSCSGIQDIASVPPNPTWEKDVRFYMEDHCVLCHGSPPNRGAPSSFRLDLYDVPNSDVLGARAMRASIKADVLSGKMPPGGGLGPNGKKMIELWVNNGAPQ